MLLLALSFSSCQRDGFVEEGIPIRFGVGEVMVKSGDTPNVDSYLNKVGNTARVYGTWTGASGSETIFDGITLTCQSVSPLSWTYDEALTRKWKKNGTYDFKAVFMNPDLVSEETIDIETGSNGSHLSISYSMHTQNYDLMVASASRDMSEGYLGPVELPFRHALAAVRFLFKKGESSAEDYYLEMLELKNLRTVGELILESADLSMDSWYLASSFRPEVAHHWDGDVLLGNSYDNYTGWFFCIPQELAVEEDESHPAIHFQVKMSGGTSVENTLEIPDTDIHGDPVKWEPGKVYSYYIGVTPQTSFVYVRVSSWDAAYVSVDEIIFD